VPCCCIAAPRGGSGVADSREYVLRLIDGHPCHSDGRPEPPHKHLVLAEKLLVAQRPSSAGQNLRSGNMLKKRVLGRFAEAVILSSAPLSNLGKTMQVSLHPENPFPCLSLSLTAWLPVAISSRTRMRPRSAPGRVPAFLQPQRTQGGMLSGRLASMAIYLRCAMAARRLAELADAALGPLSCPDKNNPQPNALARGLGWTAGRLSPRIDQFQSAVADLSLVTAEALPSPASDPCAMQSVSRPARACP